MKWSIDHIKISKLFGVILISSILFLFDTNELHAQKNISDDKITESIEFEFKSDGYVNNQNIDVATIENVATLSGTVDDLLAKERAERLASSIRGVVSVVNDLHVKNVSRWDDTIEEHVESALIVNPVVERYELESEVDNANVKLHGEVESWHEKLKAEKIAKSIKGVQSVDNMISVNYTVDRPDSEIKPEVESRLKLDPYVNEDLINVYVEDGHVMLDGIVGTLEERNIAYRKALINGVHSVDATSLAIQWWAEANMQKRDKYTSMTDEEIQDAVNSSLMYDPRVSSYKISVDADSGIITLSGTVDNMEAKKVAAEDARNTEGVWIVDNNINVIDNTKRSDNIIMQDIETALSWNSITESHQIDVEVEDNVVTLSGNVETRFEKNTAADLVANVKGVTDIKNDINVSPIRAAMTDRRIEEQINDELFWSFWIDSDDVKVNVDDGVAELKGTVDTWNEHNAAIENAFEGGADIVKSRLSVNGDDMFDNLTYYYDDFYYYWNEM
jgi:osmotically-inducible protein OsmY